MTFIILILLFTLVFGVLLAAELLRSREADGTKPFGEVSTNPVSLEPIERLIQNDDAEMVAGNPRLSRRLDANRRRVMRTYLNELRSEFLRAFEICRLLAPVSPDPDIVSRLVRSYATFHIAYSIVWFRCMTGIPVPAGRLVSIKRPFEEMRTRATELLDIDSSLAAQPSS